MNQGRLHSMRDLAGTLHAHVPRPDPRGIEVYQQWWEKNR
jgi:hypothetical protein